VFQATITQKEVIQSTPFTPHGTLGKEELEKKRKEREENLSHQIHYGDGLLEEESWKKADAFVLVCFQWWFESCANTRRSPSQVRICYTRARENSHSTHWATAITTVLHVQTNKTVYNSHMFCSKRSKGKWSHRS